MFVVIRDILQSFANNIKTTSRINQMMQKKLSRPSIYKRPLPLKSSGISKLRTKKSSDPFPRTSGPRYVFVLELSYSVVDNNYNKLPPLEKDLFWKSGNDTEIPYTLASQGLADQAFKGSAVDGN
uniref:Uncharacterized protein n=1 Tax=Romanomermis culicivorax TaxID=13658 RepID=A0A915HVA1_ROMCU